IGRYILQPEVFDELERHDIGAGDEIQLTDAMARTIGRVPFHGLRFEGRRFDCGNKAGFLEANVAFALARSDLADDMTEILRRYGGGAD
ncbi:MAG: UTP--glucose-1-phosphate uridylyltransferase, partial [Pseudomonadota bacterium]